MAYLPPGVAPCKEGRPAGGAENSWSQVVVEVGLYSVQYLPPGVGPHEEGGPTRGAEKKRSCTYRLA
jgi:hypothetical protein